MAWPAPSDVSGLAVAPPTPPPWMPTGEAAQQRLREQFEEASRSAAASRLAVEDAAAAEPAGNPAGLEPEPAEPKPEPAPGGDSPVLSHLVITSPHDAATQPVVKPPPGVRYAGVRLAPAYGGSGGGCAGCIGLAKNVSALAAALEVAQTQKAAPPTSQQRPEGSLEAAAPHPVAQETACRIRVRATRHIRTRTGGSAVVVRRKTKGYVIESVTASAKRVLFDQRKDGSAEPLVVSKDWLEPCGRSAPALPPLLTLFNTWAATPSTPGVPMLPKRHFAALFARTGVVSPAAVATVFRCVRDDASKAVDYEAFRDRALPMLAQLAGVPNLTAILLGIPQYSAYTTAYPQNPHAAL